MEKHVTKTTKMQPVPGYEHCYHLDNRKKIYWYLIDNNGTVISYRKHEPKEVNPTFFDKAHTLGPVVRLVDKDKKAKMHYVRKLVYLAFGKQHVSDVAENRYKVINKDGDIMNNHISNLEAKSAGDLVRERNEGKHRNKFESSNDLPSDAIVFDPEIPVSMKDVDNLYFYHNDLYHKVNHFSNRYKDSGYAGILGIRVKAVNTPEYYLQHLKERNTFRKNNDNPDRKRHQTIPLSVILMHEVYNNPRPGAEYHIRYKDENSFNLTEENLEWESPKERAQRVFVGNEAHEDMLRKLSQERVKGDREFFEAVERGYFLEGKKIRQVIREMGLGDAEYFRAYHYLRKVREGEVEAKLPEVKSVILNK